MPLHLRHARVDDVPALAALELRAAERFAQVPGFAFVADLGVRSPEEHAAARETGLALVAMIDADPAGFALVVPIDGHAHLLELDVDLDRQGQGLGRALLSEVEAWARASGYRELTLTTFVEPSWNAPFYARQGWAAFEVHDSRVELREVLADEGRAGIDRRPRVAMRKALCADATS